MTFLRPLLQLYIPRSIVQFTSEMGLLGDLRAPIIGLVLFDILMLGFFGEEELTSSPVVLSFRVHPKKRNLLDATKRKKLEFVQFGANLMEENKKRKARSHEVLLAQDASDVQEWIVEGDVDDASARSRDLFDEEFKSASEEEVDEEVE
ncbi:hypothetical protein CTI12_AA528040 [Artemisia annua]|uniref:Uncharacterized protein n=1 Tax=Artemisia annua TaxID=35608 RepID=A0A2U1L5I6_ARTAN|nr:hypothetical protein CTI12_AA528040 [Artemisia annua]